MGKRRGGWEIDEERVEGGGGLDDQLIVMDARRQWPAR